MGVIDTEGKRYLFNNDIFADAFNYTVDGINKGYVSEKDLQSVIRDEYGTTVVMK